MTVFCSHPVTCNESYKSLIIEVWNPKASMLK